MFREQLKNHPEAREEEEKTTLGDIVERTREKFNFLVRDFFLRFSPSQEAKDLRKYEKEAKESTELGQEIRNYILYLLQEEQESQEEEKKTSSFEDRLGRYKDLVWNDEREADSFADRVRLLSDLVGPVTHEDEETLEFKTGKNKEVLGKTRNFSRRIGSDEDEVVLQEKVTRLTTEESEIGFVEARLGALFPDGRKVDLSTFLPKGYGLTPERANTQISGFLPANFDIDSYKGFGDTGSEATPENQSWWFHPEPRKVGYGEIAEKGGFLSLFHEMAHAWRNEIYQDKTSIGLELLESLVFYFAFRGEMEDKNGKDSFGDKSPEEWEKTLRAFVKNRGLEREGVESLYQEIRTLSEKPESGEHFLEIKIPKDQSETITVLFPKIIVEKISKQAAQEERSSWAVAIRLIRYLRKKKNMDFEPELRKAEDFKKIVSDSCLSSYQGDLENIVGQRVTNFFTKKET